MYGKNIKMNEYYEVANYLKLKGDKAKILDVGCGYGVFLEKFVKNGFGIDGNYNHVNVCKKRGLNVIHGYAEKIPFKDNEFDCVILMQTLEHSLKPDEVFKEIFRVLKPGGLFICTTPSYMSPNAWADITHVKTFSIWGLSNLAIDNGFQLNKLYASSIVGENNRLTRYIFRKLANTLIFAYLQKTLYLICFKNNL